MCSTSLCIQTDTSEMFFLLAFDVSIALLILDGNSTFRIFRKPIQWLMLITFTPERQIWCFKTNLLTNTICWSGIQSVISIVIIFKDVLYFCLFLHTYLLHILMFMKSIGVDLVWKTYVFKIFRFSVTSVFKLLPLVLSILKWSMIAFSKMAKKPINLTEKQFIKKKLVLTLGNSFYFFYHNNRKISIYKRICTKRTTLTIHTQYWIIYFTIKRNVSHFTFQIRSM